ncbi:MAG TPA: DinB family protein [Caulobacteraceae bacterium]|jgi:uncharacterized damage-inducible protein DinB
MNTLLTSLFRHKAWANQGLLDALEALPADIDRMQRAIMVLTLDHTARVDQAFRARLAGETPALEAVVGERPPKLADLRATMAATDAWYVDWAGAASPDDLDEVVEFTFIIDREPGRMTKGEMLAHVLTHSASHRGAIGEMLARLDQPGASDMVTTFVSGRG